MIDRSEKRNCALEQSSCVTEWCSNVNGGYRKAIKDSALLSSLEEIYTSLVSIPPSGPINGWREPSAKFESCPGNKAQGLNS